MSEVEKKKLFLVEDDVDLAEMLCAFFRTHGYEISTTAKGEGAQELIAQSRPDIVILDIRLPDVDGYEVCRRLRRSRRTQHLPVIFLTERRATKDRLAGLELGAVDYITKPFDIQELRLRIRNALRRRELRTLHNPITGMPEGPLVKERLEQLIEKPDWGLVLVSIEGLSTFREQYGFVAADDVARAVSLMIANAMKDDGATADFVGHIDAMSFLIFTSGAHCERLAAGCRNRLIPSVQYFYPAIDRDKVEKMAPEERLAVGVVSLKSEDGSFETLADLGEALNRSFAELEQG